MKNVKESNEVISCAFASVFSRDGKAELMFVHNYVNVTGSDDSVLSFRFKRKKINTSDLDIKKRMPDMISQGQIRRHA